MNTTITIRALDLYFRVARPDLPEGAEMLDGDTWREIEYVSNMGTRNVVTGLIYVQLAGCDMRAYEAEQRLTVRYDGDTVADDGQDDWPTEIDDLDALARFVVEHVVPLERFPHDLAGAPLVGDVEIFDEMCIRCHHKPVILVEYETETDLPGIGTTEYLICPQCWAVMKMGYR